MECVNGRVGLRSECPCATLVEKDACDERLKVLDSKQQWEVFVRKDTSILVPCCRGKCLSSSHITFSVQKRSQEDHFLPAVISFAAYGEPFCLLFVDAEAECFQLSTDCFVELFNKI